MRLFMKMPWSDPHIMRSPRRTSHIRPPVDAKLKKSVLVRISRIQCRLTLDWYMNAWVSMLKRGNTRKTMRELYPISVWTNVIKSNSRRIFFQLSSSEKSRRVKGLVS